MSAPAGTVGVIYLLHFDRLYVPYLGAPLRDCAGHYRGWTTDLLRRLAEHEAGHGARLLEVVHAAGITWTLARTWQGTRAGERRLKNIGGAARQCPLCGVTPRTPVFAGVPRNRDGSVSRSRTPDVVLAAIGMMTRAQQAEHTDLRRGAARGRVPGVARLCSVPDADPWYVPALAGGAW